MSETEQRVIDRCESMGESAVRAGFIAGDFGDAPSHPDWRVAKAWLDAKDSNKRDAREIETLSIAKEANAIAQHFSTRLRALAGWSEETIEAIVRAEVRKDADWDGYEPGL